METNVWHEHHKGIVFNADRKCPVCWTWTVNGKRCKKCEDCVDWGCANCSFCRIRVPYTDFTNGCVILCDKCRREGCFVCETCVKRNGMLMCTHCGGKYKPINEPDYPPSDPNGWGCICPKDIRFNKDTHQWEHK